MRDSPVRDVYPVAAVAASGATTAARGGPRASGRLRAAPSATIAVLLPRFPLLAEAPVLCEIEELERQGQPVCLVPLSAERSPVEHLDAEECLPRTLLAPTSFGTLLAANLRSLSRRPLRYGLLLSRLALRSLPSFRVLVSTLAQFPQGVYLAERMERAGIRHVHAHQAAHAAVTALIISSLTPITFSVTVHACDLFLGWRRPLLALKVRRAAFVRVESKFNQSFLRALYPESAGKIRLIHTGVDPDRYAPPRSSHRRSARDASDGYTRPQLLCVAALEAWNGLPVLIEACARLVATGLDFGCAIVGEGRLRQSLEHQIAQARLENRVRLPGAARPDELPVLLRRAAVVVLPSKVAPDAPLEEIPASLIEAMAAERPVVASAILGIPELVDHGATGFVVEPGSAGALTDAIAVLLLDPARAREMGRRGRAKVQRAFRLDTCAAALLHELHRTQSARNGGGQRWRPFGAWLRE